MTMLPVKLMRMKTLITGQITCENTAMIGQTNQWTNWKQNMMMTMTEETILGQLNIIRRMFLP